MFKHKLKSIILVLGLSACGTTYDLPNVTAASQMQAEAIFAQERGVASRSRATPAEAAARFRRVVARVTPVAVAICRTHLAEQTVDTCDLPVLVDAERREVNAYQARDERGPFIAFTVPMLMQIESDDEMAFILGHEWGHHIAAHIEKGERQAMAGALILGAITAASQAYATQADPYRYTGSDGDDIHRSMELGAAIGNTAYRQTYELESDVIATHIAADAGFDPVRGARFFARPAEARTSTGRLSFWGTHPPDAKRLATVIETARGAATGGELEPANR